MILQVLSYYQKVSNVAMIPVEYYHFAIPLVYIYGINYDKTASVIESFFGMLEMPRPKYMANVTVQSSSFFSCIEQTCCVECFDRQFIRLHNIFFFSGTCSSKIICIKSCVYNVMIVGTIDGHLEDARPRSVRPHW